MYLASKMFFSHCALLLSTGSCFNMKRFLFYTFSSEMLHTQITLNFEAN